MSLLDHHLVVNKLEGASGTGTRGTMGFIELHVAPPGIVIHSFLSQSEENAKLWVAENQRKENQRKHSKLPGIPNHLWVIPQKERMISVCWLMSGYFRMASVLCKPAKLQVGSNTYLGLLLKIFRVNLHWNFNILCTKDELVGSWAIFRPTDVLNIFSSVTWYFYPYR